MEYTPAGAIGKVAGYGWWPAFHAIARKPARVRSSPGAASPVTRRSFTHSSTESSVMPGKIVPGTAGSIENASPRPVPAAASGSVPAESGEVGVVDPHALHESNAANATMIQTRVTAAD